MRTLFSIFLGLNTVAAAAQYAPQVSIMGTNAISKNSSQFAAWATGCHLQLGLQQIGNLSSGRASLGDSTSALGMADNNVVSLGDSGIAVLTFPHPITNGPGPDFAVFENGFANVSNPEEAFLELAFVEVSSDGINFTRFSATSLTQDTVQLSPVGQPSYINARQINNLAGKYIGGWGTPFDLSELAGTPGLDVSAITHVRLIDVIGSIGPEASHDASGHKINDPFPSPFPSSGFDLDAVGVIHEVPTSIGSMAEKQGISIFPNPAGNRVVVKLPNDLFKVALFDATGRSLQNVSTSNGEASFDLHNLTAGTYFITIQSATGQVCSISFAHY